MLLLQARGPGLGLGGAREVTTPTGRFAFADIPARDNYFLTAAKPGYLDGGYQRADPRGTGAPIAVADGQWVRDVRVALTRPGSISGTIVDERGEPIVGAYVRLLPQVKIAGRTQLLSGAAARTDDRGAYRIAGLGPGKYVVSVPLVQATLPASSTITPPGAWAGTSLADVGAASAAARAEKLVVDLRGGQQVVVGHYAIPPSPTPDGQRTAYAIAFYPNVSTPADATPIELRTSEDRSGVDFELQPVRAARVSGVVQGPPSAVGNLLLRLMPVGLEELGQGSEAATTVTLADGQFTFFDVPAGSYVLEARHSLLDFSYTSGNETPTAVPAPVQFSTRSAASGGVTGASPGVAFASLQDGSDDSHWGQLRVDLPGRDVGDLVLPLRRAATMTGRTIAASGATTPTYSPSPVLEPADGRRSLGRPSAGFGGSPTFTISNLMPGLYVLRISGANVESVTWDGQDYTDRPFDATDGRDFTGVVVTYTTASSWISGTVSDSGAPLVTTAAVMAFPVERERWSNYGLTPSRLKSTLTTSDGRYQIGGLPIGNYYLVAVPAAQEQEWLDPAFLAAHAGRANQVRVDRSDAKLSGIALSLVK